MKIIFIISLLQISIYSSSYISITFKVKSNITKEDNDIISYLLYKGIYIDIKIGSENEELSLPVKMRIYPSFISSFSSNIKSKKYNENNSKTYIKLDNKTIKGKEDKLEGYKSLDSFSINNNIKINNFNFILTQNQIIDESGGIGLKITTSIDDISTFHNVSNFITQLKISNIINSYYFYFNFKNENEGLFIIGAEPYEIEPKNYNKNNSITVKTGINYGRNKWVFSLLNATFNNKQCFIGPSFQAEILSEIGLIYAVNMFRDIVFNDFFYQNGCFEKKSNFFSYFYCNDKDVDIKNFSDVIFTLEDNSKIYFSYKDLFYNYKGFNYFLIVFGKENNWLFGQIFLKKYYLVFNSDKKVITFYFKNETNNFNFLIILCILFGLIIIGLLGYLIYFKKLFNLKKKKRANELEDDYEYISNKNSNSETNKNLLLTKLI